MDPSRALSHHDYRFQYVVELSYLADRPVRVYRSARSRDFDTEGFWPVVQKASLFRTGRFTIKMDKGLHELMRNTPAPGGDITVLDQFWPSFDMPLHAMAVEWASKSRDLRIPVRYDPEAPDRFLLEETYVAAREGASRGWSIVGGVLLGGLGCFMLLIGVSLLAGRMHRYIPMALFCATLVAVPFASGLLHKAVGYLGISGIEESLMEELTQSMDPVARSGFLQEMSVEQQASLMTLPVDVAHSRYRDVFAFFQMSKPEKSPHSFDEAMRAMSAQITEQLVAMPAEALFSFFKILDGHMDHRQEGWDGPFLEGVRALALDGTRSASLRSWAIDAFCDMCDVHEDPKTAEFIYRQYVEADAEVKTYWRNSFWRFYLAPSFAEDLRSADRERVRRALAMWVGRRMALEDVQSFAPRLKELTTHADQEIRKMAAEIWGYRADWEQHI